jgi:hypothetical protein
MKNLTEFEPQLDLLETRRQLIAMRTLHSHNGRVTTCINELIGELAHLRQPEDRSHEEDLIRMIANTMLAIERMI